MSNTLNDLLAIFGVQLQPWMAPAFAVLIAVAMMPMYRANFRTKRARRLLQQASYARKAERAELQQQALEYAHGNPVGLVVVAEESIRRGFNELAHAALLELSTTGKRTADYRRLRLELEGDRQRTAEGEAAVLERLFDAGMTDQANERLDVALKRWPGAEPLLALKGRGAAQG